MNINQLLGKNGVVTVNFENNTKEYNYFLPNYINYDDVEIGDKVIVESPINGFTTVHVVSKSRDYLSIAERTKPVVSLVDTTQYEDWKANKQTIMDKLLEKEFSRVQEAVLGDLAGDAEVNKLIYGDNTNLLEVKGD